MTSSRPGLVRVCGECRLVLPARGGEASAGAVKSGTDRPFYAPDRGAVRPGRVTTAVMWGRDTQCPRLLREAPKTPSPNSLTHFDRAARSFGARSSLPAAARTC